LLLAGAFPGVTCQPFGWTRAGRIPASYPTAQTRRFMGPIADARTDLKVYADCHEDYQITMVNICNLEKYVNA